jgi:hypothetical protein
VLALGCNGDVSVEREAVTRVTLKAIAVAPVPPALFDGQTVALTATGTYSDGSTQDVTESATWTSSNPGVATVAGGVVTALAHGGTTIGAQSGTVRGQVAVKVAVTMTSLAVAPASLMLPANVTQAATATASYDNGTTKKLTGSVVWTSNDPTVATVTSSGLIVTVAPGSTTIVATAIGVAQAPVVGMASVTVTPATIASLAVSPGTKSVANGLVQAFRATAMFSDGSRYVLVPPVVTWSSSQPAVATIDATGLATAVGAGGPTTITATSLAGTAGRASLAVTPATLVAFAASPVLASVAAGRTAQFTVSGTYTDGTVADLTAAVAWSASPPGIATVSTAGLATSLAPGTSTITATEPITHATATGALTVTPAELDSIALSPVAPSAPAGETAQLAATGTLSDGTTRDLSALVTWDSDAPDVASVAAGLVTARISGTALVTATDPATSIASSVTFTVAPAAVVSIDVTPADPSVPLDTSAQLAALATYSDGSTADVTASVLWASTSTEVAVANAPGPAGQVTALAVGGDAIVSATDPGSRVIGATPVLASAPILEALAITPQPVSLLAGRSQQLVATGTLSDGSSVGYTSTVAWSASSSVVFVASGANVPDGLAIAQQIGDATVVATDPVTGVTASVDVSVALNPDDDAASTLSPWVNPAGDWAFGWESAPGAGFELGTAATAPGSALVEWSGCSADDCTYAARDTGDSPELLGAAAIAPGELALVPPLADPSMRSAARWTAPVAGTYQIRATFSGNGAMPSDVAVGVLYDGAPSYAAELAGTDIHTFATSLHVAAGDTLDFEVGNDGDPTADLDPIAFDAEIETCEQAGLVDCGSACVDVTSDAASCGACGNACTTDEPGTIPACAAGACSFACDPDDATCTGASLVLDFAGGTAYVDGRAHGFGDVIATSRSTGGYAQDSTGVWHYFPPDAPRITDRGLLAEQTRTNVVRQDRDLTASVWVATDAVVAHDQTGIDAVAGSASSMLAVQDGATVVQAISDGSRARTITAFVARLAGCGAVAMTIDGGATWIDVPVDGAWTRVGIPARTLANPAVGFRLAGAGDAIAVDFVQVENSAVFATSPIATADAAGVRMADSVQLVDPASTSLAAGTWFCELGELAGHAAGTTQEVVNMRVDAADKIVVELAASDAMQAVSFVGGEFSAQLASAVPASPGPSSRVAFAYAPAACAAAFSPELGGNFASSTTCTVPSGPFTVSIGSNLGQQLLDGYIRRAEWSPVCASDQFLESWASP